MKLAFSFHKNPYHGENDRQQTNNPILAHVLLLPNCYFSAILPHPPLTKS